jgi:hypothetical protein
LFEPSVKRKLKVSVDTVVLNRPNQHALYNLPAIAVKVIVVPVMSTCAVIPVWFAVMLIGAATLPKGKLFAWAAVYTAPVVKVVFGEAISTPVY